MYGEVKSTDGLKINGKGEGLAMQVACTNQGSLCLVRAVLLHLGIMSQGVLHLRADHVLPLLVRQWKHRILR